MGGNTGFDAHDSMVVAKVLLKKKWTLNHKHIQKDNVV